jgi:hypothetical protein
MLSSSIHSVFRILYEANKLECKKDWYVGSFSIHSSYKESSFNISSAFFQFHKALAALSAKAYSNCLLFSKKYLSTLILCLKKYSNSLCVFQFFFARSSTFHSNVVATNVIPVHEGNFER